MGRRALLRQAARCTGGGLQGKQSLVWLAPTNCPFSTRARSKQSGALVDPANATPKKLALAMAIKQVESSYGKGSLMQLGGKEVAQVDVVPTGSLSLDQALRIGGLPRGRVVEIYGQESSGKTTVALHAVAQCQKQGGTAVFVDAEHALDPSYARAIGVNLDDLYVSQPDSGEQALDIVETLVKSGAVDVVVVDSVAALVPKAELEGDMGDHHIALQARLMSQALRKLTAVLSKSRTLIIFINQIRQKVGVVFGNPEVTSGGNALRFYASVRLSVSKGQQIKGKDGVPIGNIVKVKVAKNKLAPPFGQAEFDLLYGQGVDRVGEVLDLAIKAGAVRKSGSWFALDESVPPTAVGLEGQQGPVLLGQGRDKAKAYLTQHPEVAAPLEKLVLARFEENPNLGRGTAKPAADIPSLPPGQISGAEDDTDEFADGLEAISALGLQSASSR